MLISLPFALLYPAVLAVGVAAVGVIGAFKMALWAASESGRSMDPKQEPGPSAAAAVPSAASPTKEVYSRIRR